MVYAFSLDEGLNAAVLKKALDHQTFALEIYKYGHLYFNMALIPLLFVNRFTPVSEQVIIVMLRAIPTLFAMATVTMTFLLTRRYVSRLAAWLAACLLTVVPLNFLHWSVTSHPDIPQLFFLVLGVYFCCRLAEQGHWRWLAAASAAAGWAFACKYGGLFLLPLIWGVTIAQTLIDPEMDGLRISQTRFIKGAQGLILTLGILAIGAGATIAPEHFVHLLALNEAATEIQPPTWLTLLRAAIIFIGLSLILMTWLRFRQFEQNRSEEPIVGLNKIILKLALSVTAFSLAFIIASPFSLVNLGFIQGMIYESRHSFFEHEFTAGGNGLLWLDLLRSPDLLDNFLLGLTAVSLVLALATLFRKGWSQLLSPPGVIWLWTIFFLAFLVLRVDMRRPRFMLPLIPFVIILSVLPINQVAEYIRSKLSKRLAAPLIIVMLLIIIGLELPPSLGQILAYRRLALNRVEESSSVVAGEWLVEHYPASTRILYDHYSYIPPFFRDTHTPPWLGETTPTLQTIQPDIVVVNQAIAARFSDLKSAPTYVWGEDNFRLKYEYYQRLKNEKLGYILVRDFGDIQIYERQ